jgi:hypothetical protein
MTLPDFITDDLLKAVGGVLGMALLYGLSRIKNATVRFLANLAVDKGIPIAFNYVEELSRKTPNKLDDKAALALNALRKYLDTYGVKPTLEQESRARIVFDALHAEVNKNQYTDKDAAKVAQAQFEFLANPVGDGDVKVWNSSVDENEVK